MTTENILGYEIFAQGIEKCTKIIAEKCQHANSRSWLACFNPHSYAVAVYDREFSTALKSADYLVPDGVGAVLASRIMCGNIHDRVTGFDVFSSLNEEINAIGGMSVFFLGSTQDTLDAISARMKREYPNIRLAGTYSPPFKAVFSDEELADMINAVNSTSPDVLWVGMTAPKQEKWLENTIDRLDVRFAAAIGAVFDFYAGKIKRSSPLFQRLGLEWLPRLLQEPRRLWRRMFISAPIFVWHVIKARFGYYPGH